MNTAPGPPGWAWGYCNTLTLKKIHCYRNIKHEYVNATRLENEKVSSEKRYDAMQRKPKGICVVEVPSNNQEVTKDGYMERQNLV